MKKHGIAASAALVAAGLLGIFLACAKGGISSSGAGSDPIFAGTWSGVMNYAIGGCGPASGTCNEALILTQSSTAFNGSDQCSVGNAASSGTHHSTGTVNGNSFTLAQSPYACGSAGTATASFMCTQISSISLNCSLNGTACDSCNAPQTIVATGTLTSTQVGF